MTHVKNFNEYCQTLLENKINEEEQELTKIQKDYQDVFTVALIKFGAKTPDDLDDEDKTKFFDWISKNWDKDKSEQSDEAKELIKKAREEGLLKDDEPKVSKKANDDIEDAAQKLD